MGGSCDTCKHIKRETSYVDSIYFNKSFAIHGKLIHLKPSVKPKLRWFMYLMEDTGCRKRILAPNLTSMPGGQPPSLPATRLTPILQGYTNTFWKAEELKDVKVFYVSVSITIDKLLFLLQNILTDVFQTRVSLGNKILLEYTSIAHGRFPLECGRLCGSHWTIVLKPISWRVSTTMFWLKSYLSF